MSEFLNDFANRTRNPDKNKLSLLSDSFKKTTSLFNEIFKSRSFRLTRTLNVAVYDSCMVGLATRLQKEKNPDLEKVKAAYEGLLTEKEYIEAVSRSTADDAFVNRRLNLAIEAFSRC